MTPLLTIQAWVIALVLCYTGATKLWPGHSLAWDESPVGGMLNQIGGSRISRRIVGTAELLLGGALLVRPTSDVMRPVALAFMVAGAIYVFWVLRTRPGRPCGCTSSVNPVSWSSVTRSFILVAFATLLVTTPTTMRVSTPAAMFIGAFEVLLLAVVSSLGRSQSARERALTAAGLVLMPDKLIRRKLASSGMWRDITTSWAATSLALGPPDARWRNGRARYYEYTIPSSNGSRSILVTADVYGVILRLGALLVDNDGAVAGGTATTAVLDHRARTRRARSDVASV